MTDEIETGATSAAPSEETQAASEAAPATELTVTSTVEAAEEAPAEAAPEPAPADAVSATPSEPELYWFTVVTASEREPIALRATDHEHAVEQFKKLRGIISTPHAINAHRAEVYQPNSPDLEYDAVLYPERQQKA